MSNRQADAAAEAELPASGGRRRRGLRAAVLGGAVWLGIGGLAACGDDDDASNTVPVETDESTVSTAESDPTTTAAASTSSAPSTTAAPATTTAAPAAAETAAPGSTAPSDAEAVTDVTDAVPASSAATTDAAAVVTATSSPSATEPTTGAVDSSAPPGSAPESTAPDDSGPPASVGPTTTGPECEYVENDEFPLERCDAGPAIAAVQSVLQAREYEIGTVDCLFGDQTFYAVQALQIDEDLPVTGAVDEDTWAALDVLDDWGDDDNGNGSIEPNEITLECA